MHCCWQRSDDPPPPFPFPEQSSIHMLKQGAMLWQLTGPFRSIWYWRI